MGGQTHQFRFTDADFNAIAKRAYDDFGLHLQSSKKELVYSRLTKHLRRLNLSDFASYCEIINKESAQAERMEMLSALTTNVTHFFREPHHFALLREKALPPLIERARAGGRIRIWSAGCSAGQEPYSIAAAVLDVFPDAARFDCKILATDVDPMILARAKAGQYRQHDIENLEPAKAKTMFAKAKDGSTDVVAVDNLRDLITFGEINLIGQWPTKGMFDAIFCRNVAIYFDKPTQSILWKRFHDQLNVGGHLMIGHSERLNGPAADALENVGVTAFKRTA